MIKNPQILELNFLDDDHEGGTNFIALVENPAIEVDFFAFANNQTIYRKYPQGITDTAKRGIKLNEKVDNKCATDVGKQRAQDLANKRPLSLKTIKRMYAYLSRARAYYKPSDTEACGTISYLLWGGDPALRWTERILKQVREEAQKSYPSSTDRNEVGSLLDEDGDWLQTEDGDYLNGDGTGHTPTFTFSNNEEQVLRDYFNKMDVILEYIDGLPLFETPQEAQLVAGKAGCEGYHEHEVEGVTLYMPCSSHSEATDKLLQEMNQLVKQHLASLEATEVNPVEMFSDVFSEDNEQRVKTHFNVVDTDEQVIVSPVMIPGLPIARRNANGELFYAYFSKDTVKRMAHKFLKQNYTNNINLEHDQSMKLNGVSVVESFITTEDDTKATKYGYDLPEGTWVVMMKVEDKNLWKLIKAGKVKGLSLEGGFFRQKISQ